MKVNFTLYLLISIISLNSCSNSPKENSDNSKQTSNDIKNEISDTVNSRIQEVAKKMDYRYDSIYRGYYFEIHKGSWSPSIYTSDAHPEPDKLDEFIANETNVVQKKQEVDIEGYECLFEFIENGKIIRQDTSHSGLITTLIWTDWALNLIIKDSTQTEIYSKKIGREVFYNKKLTMKDEFGNETKSPKKDYYINDVVYSNIYGVIQNKQIKISLDYFSDVSYGENGFAFVLKLDLNNLNETYEAFTVCTRCEGPF
jgi:hypothetical protein